MNIIDIKEKISPIFRKFGVTYAAIFGSVSRGEDRKDSDIDILVRLGRPTGMFLYMQMINSLEEILGRKVDMVTEQSLNKFVKPHVMPDLKTIYEG